MSRFAVENIVSTFTRKKKIMSLREECLLKYLLNPLDLLHSTELLKINNHLIEKGLSGIGSSGDSGVSTRIFGQFLTWMQEKEAPVFVIATANNISHLPPELLRKGRFDEIFFVDLPTLSERKEIFKLHLEKRLKDKNVASEIIKVKGLCEELAKRTEGFIGSEIEQVVVSSLCDAFFENRPLMFEDLEKNISTTVPLSMTQREQILALREWANVRAVSAAKTSNLKKYSKEINAENVTASRGGRTLDF